MENEEKREEMVKREVRYDVTHLISELMTQDKYLDDLINLAGHEDAEGNMPEVFEYWLVTDWLAEKLEACGELVVKDFFNLSIWGRQTTGQPIYADDVIGRIIKKGITQ